MKLLYAFLDKRNWKIAIDWTAEDIDNCYMRQVKLLLQIADRFLYHCSLVWHGISILSQVDTADAHEDLFPE